MPTSTNDQKRKSGNDCERSIYVGGFETIENFKLKQVINTCVLEKHVFSIYYN